MLHQRGLAASRVLGRSLPRRAPQNLLRPVQRRFASAEQDAIELKGAADNAFNRERLAVKQHAEETTDLWRKLSLYVVIPAIILAAANTYVQWNEHWEHQAHEPPVNRRPQYAYQNIRTKAFPWGNGDKTLFWNEHYNVNRNTEE